MLVSIVIPACAAHDCLARAVRSLLAQTHARWEAILVSDDRSDYLSHLAGLGIADPRLRQVFTGGVRTGCHRARNIGLAAALGDFVTQLDADDEFTPQRLAQLLPLAQAQGAAADNLELRDAATGAALYRALGDMAGPIGLAPAQIVALTTPLVPLIRRDHVVKRVEGVELAEDVVANLQLAARIGRLTVTPQSSYVYNIHGASICHAPGAADRFDAAYAGYVARLRDGDGFGLAPDLRALAQAAFEDKRAMNAAYGAASAAGFAGSFQHFALEWRARRGAI